MVNKLRELKDCTDRYRDAATGDLPPGAAGSGSVLCGTPRTSVDERGGGVSEAACGDEGPSSWMPAVSTQSDAVGTADAAMNCDVHDDSVAVGTMTEDELKAKHNQVSAIRVNFTPLTAYLYT